jgi:hypothetical protein
MTEGCGEGQMSDMYQLDLFESLGESADQYTYSLPDFRVKLFQLLENAKDSRTALEVLYFLKSSGMHLYSDHGIYFWKTSLDSSITMGEEPSKPLSDRWMNWGTWANGVCLTARPMSPKTVSAFSLSQVLEEQVDERYFLSAEKTETLLKSLAG